MSSQGGKRKGAGRKPRSSPRKAVTVRLETEVCEKFQALRIANERSESAQFAEMVKRARLPQNAETTQSANGDKL